MASITGQKMRAGTVHLPPGHFFGTTINDWCAGAFYLSESEYAPDATLPVHAHARAYLTYVVAGGHTETAGFAERECLPATVVFHPPGERHTNKFSPDGGRIFRLEIGEEWLARLRDGGARLDEPAASRRGPLSLIAGRMLAEFRTRDSVSLLMLESLTTEFASRIVRAHASRTRKAPPWLPRVTEYVRGHAHRAVRLDEIARAANVHPAHLNRVFREEYGYSVGEYLRRVRVDLAAEELVHSTQPMSAIAAALGFADQSHFSRVFVRVTGMTPGRYRRLRTTRS